MISRAIQTCRTATRNVCNAALNSKLLKGISTKQAGDAAATIALVSTISKDAVNCAYYTYQSMTNEEIDPDKRNYVAGIDLFNGILNVVTQSTAAVWIKDKLPGFFEKIASAKLKQNNDAFKLAQGGFTLLGTLVFAQIFLKRVVTPFIATPLAHYFKEYADKKALQAKEKRGEQGVQSQDLAKNKDTNVQQKDTANKSEKTASVEKVSAPQNIFFKTNNKTFESFEGLLK